MMWPDADFTITTELVTRLLAEQAAELAPLALEHYASGFDNEIFRIGDEWLIRLPRRHVAIELLRNEITWLPDLAHRVNLSVPVPVIIGHSTDFYPSPWTVTRWIVGTPLDNCSLTHTRQSADALGEFLRHLQIAAPVDAPRSAVRGVPLAQRADAFNERRHLLIGDVDTDFLTETFDLGVTALPWDEPPVWLHGDLHPGNVIVRDGAIGAVIDFGDMCCGDPASDVAGAWMILPSYELTHFWAAFGRDDAALRLRARGWAAFFAVMFLCLGKSVRPSYWQVGQRTLACLRES